MEWYLPVIWGVIIGVAVIMYVVLDGFDLGIGILFPFAKEERERDVMMNTVAPFWDGNETWLILGGGGLWVAFPKAYAVVMPALYLPVIIMLLALVFRGVAFEFRWVALSSRRWWPPSPRASSWVDSCRASRWKTAHSPAARSTGRRRSPSCAASAWWWAIRFSARPGC